MSVVPDMPEADYFRSPALSCSGAKLLLPPNCPAMYKWRQDNPQEHKQAFDVGHAAHAKVLGVGAPVRVIDHDSWRTKAAQAERDEAYAEGRVPLLAAEALAVDAMADAILSHPVASALFAPGTGQAEQSLFWHDDKHGIDKRARLDWLRPAVDGRAIAVDLKTANAVDKASISKAVASYMYDAQAVHYSDGVKACGLAEDVAFLFVFVAKTPPHLITVVELDDSALARGRALMDRASELFAECTATDEWPGHATDIELISLPRWATFTEDFAA